METAEVITTYFSCTVDATHDCVFFGLLSLWVFWNVSPGACVTMVLKDIPAENITRPLGRNEVIGLLFRLTIFGAVTYFTIKWMVDAIDPTRKQKVEAQKQVFIKKMKVIH